MIYLQTNYLGDNDQHLLNTNNNENSGLFEPSGIQESSADDELDMAILKQNTCLSFHSMYMLSSSSYTIHPPVLVKSA
jgi:hypothetical protein